MMRDGKVYRGTAVGGAEDSEHILIGLNLRSSTGPFNLAPPSTCLLQTELASSLQGGEEPDWTRWC